MPSPSEPMPSPSELKPSPFGPTPSPSELTTQSFQPIPPTRCDRCKNHRKKCEPYTRGICILCSLLTPPRPCTYSPPPKTKREAKGKAKGKMMAKHSALRASVNNAVTNNNTRFDSIAVDNATREATTPLRNGTRDRGIPIFADARVNDERGLGADRYEPQMVIANGSEHAPSLTTVAAAVPPYMGTSAVYMSAGDGALTTSATPSQTGFHPFSNAGGFNIRSNGVGSASFMHWPAWTDNIQQGIPVHNIPLSGEIHQEYNGGPVAHGKSQTGSQPFFYTGGVDIGYGVGRASATPTRLPTGNLNVQQGIPRQAPAREQDDRPVHNMALSGESYQGYNGGPTMSATSQTEFQPFFHTGGVDIGHGVGSASATPSTTWSLDGQFAHPTSGVTQAPQGSPHPYETFVHFFNQRL